MWSQAREKITATITLPLRKSETARLVTAAAARTVMLMIIYVASKLPTGKAGEATAFVILALGPLTFWLCFWIMRWQTSKRNARKADPETSPMEYLSQSLRISLAGGLFGLGGVCLIVFAISLASRWDVTLESIFSVLLDAAGLTCAFAATKLLGMWK